MTYELIGVGIAGMGLGAVVVQVAGMGIGLYVKLMIRAELATFKDALKTELNGRYPLTAVVEAKFDAVHEEIRRTRHELRNSIQGAVKVAGTGGD